MPPITDISSWDAIRNTQGDVVLTIPPVPRPRMVLVAADAVYILTDGLPLRLSDSDGVIGIVVGARTLVIAEADERISRETLVPVARTPYHLDGRTTDELEAA